MQRNKVMRLIPKHWIAIASLLALPLHGVAAKEPLPFNEFRVGLIETVMNSCMRSQTEPAIQIYMDKANTQGANFTDHAQTLAHLEKMPEWTQSIVPEMKNLCACAFGAEHRGNARHHVAGRARSRAACHQGRGQQARCR